MHDLVCGSRHGRDEVGCVAKYDTESAKVTLKISGFLDGTLRCGHMSQGRIRVTGLRGHRERKQAGVSKVGD